MLIFATWASELLILDTRMNFTLLSNFNSDHQVITFEINESPYPNLFVNGSLLGQGFYFWHLKLRWWLQKYESSKSNHTMIYFFPCKKRMLLGYSNGDLELFNVESVPFGLVLLKTWQVNHRVLACIPLSGDRIFLGTMVKNGAYLGSIDSG